uniref:Dihydrofolate synthase/folylpolyglutamate synthase n=1 Tax=Chlorobium chlorochromatii (strain CaD3) TaxID=340177 RepID=Q3ATE4_CHLCH
MTYQEALNFLYPLHRFGIKPGLERVQALLQTHGNPHKRLGRVVHLAGTNGKGTTAAALAAMFQASGYKTALYTSPHLVDFTERIRINGQPISQEFVAHYCAIMQSTIQATNATFFEATTALAFSWFADEAVEVAVIETGLGGRLDATNVVEPEFVVIPTIGRDHVEWLGVTLPAIAAEKAAIIKQGCSVFTAATQPEVLAVIEQQAQACNAALFLAGRDVHYEVVASEPGLLGLHVQTATQRYAELYLPLTGTFHAATIALSVQVAECAGLSAHIIKHGLQQLLQTGYRARLEFVNNAPAIFLDVSHNPDGMKATVDALLTYRERYKRTFVLLGLASDKDALAVIRELQRLNPLLVAVNIPSERSVAAEQLGALCQQEGIEFIIQGDSVAGLRFIEQQAGERDMVLITGSFFLAGELLAHGFFKAVMQ